MKATLTSKRFQLIPADLFIVFAVLALGTVFIAPTLLPVSLIHWAAAVTVVARTKRFNVTGARWIYEYSITGDNTNTLDTPVANGKRLKVLVEPCTITGIAQSAVNGKIRLTFTTTGAFTAVGLLAYAG